MPRKKKGAGSSLAEILIAAAAVGLISSMLVVRGSENRLSQKEAMLRADTKALQEALDQYRRDHGFYPCTPPDANRSADAATFRRQLTWYTDARGRVSSLLDSVFCFGPYLRAFPSNPFASSGAPESAIDVVIDTVSSSGPDRLVAPREALTAGRGGWYYLPKTGQILPIVPSREILERVVTRR